MSVLPTPSSIYDIPPLETGGQEARKGFAFQDHVAAGFCLELLTDPLLIEVWCETQDDITLIWQASPKVVEYVQVKSNDLDQLWTAAILCDREQKGKGHSIVEKSLAYDRCQEKCLFRVVTSRPVKNELKALTYPFESPARKSSAEDIVALHEVMKPKVGDFLSANQHDFTHWLQHTYWDVRHSEESVRNANVLKLFRFLHGQDDFIAMDQVEEIYARLVRKVFDAGRVDARIAPEDKRILKAGLEIWLRNAVSELSGPSAGNPKKVSDKMRKAHLSDDVIAMALDQRRHYRAEVLSPKYLPLDHRRLIDLEVTALLHNLKSRLDNAKIDDDGMQFHDLCLSELQKLRDELPLTPKPPLGLLNGCMYSVTGRCLHRFRRVTA